MPGAAPRTARGSAACLFVLLMALGSAWRDAQAQTKAPAPPPPRIFDRSCRDTLPSSAAQPLAASPVALPWHSGLVPWTEWAVQLGASRVPVTVVVARIDPTRVTLALDIVRDGNAMGAWSIARAADTAAVAFNAGQFTDAGPWGWVVHRGREWQAPGAGALAASIVVDSSGGVRIVPAGNASRWHAGDRRPLVREAIQSYPQLLAGGRLPAALCRPRAINRGHRDIRLAFGVRNDGQVLVALTRYAPPALLPNAAARLPIGPTTLEMAELMHRLGAVDAVMLDGGLSAQLRIGSPADGRAWPGLRDVPLALVGYPR